MSASGVPIMKYVAITAGSTGLIDFGQEVSYVYVRNLGPNSAYMAVGATPPTASPGDGRIELKLLQPLAMNDVGLSGLAFSTAALETAGVEAVAYPVLANR